MKRLLLGLLSVTLSSAAMASTVGISNHPFLMKKHVISTEYNNYQNSGAGMGLNINYLRKVSDELNFNAGFGSTNGERGSKFFLGADMQIIPDYGTQPRVSIKGLLETERVDGDRINSFGIAPTLSKGLAFWGNEAFPFIALPIKLNLNENEREYQTSTAIAAGITGRLPFADFKNVVGNIEMNVSLENSYSAFVMGVSLPIQ